MASKAAQSRLDEVESIDVVTLPPYPQPPKGRVEDSEPSQSVTVVTPEDLPGVLLGGEYELTAETGWYSMKELAALVGGSSRAISRHIYNMPPDAVEKSRRRRRDQAGRLSWEPVYHLLKKDIQ